SVDRYGGSVFHDYDCGFFFFSSRRRHTRWPRDWSSDVCSSDLWNRAVTLSVEQFKYGWANTLSNDEAKQLHETFHVAAPGAPLFQAASANLNPWTEAKVNSKSSDRGDRKSVVWERVRGPGGGGGRRKQSGER